LNRDSSSANRAGSALRSEYDFTMFSPSLPAFSRTAPEKRPSVLMPIMVEHTNADPPGTSPKRRS